MRSVSRFESNLLRILHCFLGQTTASHIMPAIVRPARRPRCLSRDAVELIQQSLGVGTVTLLAREGGWYQQRHLREDEIRAGNLWQRTDPSQLGLEFSAATLDFLIWVTAADATKRMPRWQPQHPAALTIGDQYLLFVAARALRHTTLLSDWFSEGVFRSNALIALFLPDQFAAVNSTPRPDFSPWVSGKGSYVLEAIQDRLTRNWVTIERNKGRLTQADQMLRLGRAQDAALDSLFDAAESAGRRDLCRFAMEAASELLDSHSRAKDWIGCLDKTDLRIADRTEVYQSASALLRQRFEWRGGTGPVR